MDQANPQDEEIIIRNAAEMIASGTNAEKVIRFVYRLGHMRGALELAKAGSERVMQEALKRAAT